MKKSLEKSYCGRWTQIRSLQLPFSEINHKTLVDPHVSGMPVQEPATDSAPALHNNLARLA